MKSGQLGTPALMLSVILWGTLLGGIAYSHLVYFPVFLSSLPESAAVVVGPFGLHEEVFWLTLHPALILSLLASLVLNWKSPRRRLIGLSAGVYAVVLIVSQLYFIPELIAFAGSQESEVAAAQWRARAGRWETLSWLRGAVCYAACVPLLLALTRPAPLTDTTTM